MKITATAVSPVNERKAFTDKNGKPQASQKWRFEFTEQGSQYASSVLATVYTPGLDRLINGQQVFIDLSIRVKTFQAPEGLREYNEITAYIIPVSGQQAAPAPTRQPAAQAAMPAAYNDPADGLPF